MMDTQNSLKKKPEMIRARLFFLFLTGLFSISLLSSLSLKAQGDLLITPRRVVFDGKMKSHEINLANTGKETATYNVSIIQYRMKEDGSFEEIFEPDPGQKFADPYIRFFPRTVTLAPNEAQVVKIQLNKTGELTDGEYRSHIYFRAVPDQKPLGEEEIPKDTTSITVKLTPIFGITIPVIIRVGVSTTNMTISDLALTLTEENQPRLSMTLNRTGNMSVYGEIEVTYLSAQGKKTQVGQVKGIAVYAPNPTRKLQLDLVNTQDMDLKSGKILVTFTEQSDVKEVKLAEAVLTLP